MARPCKSQPCDVILVTQEMRVRETVVSLYAHKRHSLERRALEDGENGVPCPSGLPWRLQCNIQAYAASQPSGGGRGGGA